eukprot:12414212-Karenia_brevis.AAC.1
MLEFGVEAPTGAMPSLTASEPSQWPKVKSMPSKPPREGPSLFCMRQELGGCHKSGNPSDSVSTD